MCWFYRGKLLAQVEGNVEKKATQESLRDELVGVSALTPDPVLTRLPSPKGAVGK